MTDIQSVRGWVDYQEKSSITAIYPGANWNEFGILYASLGLVDEVGEAFELIDSDNTAIARDKLIKEISDVLWYLSRVHVEWRLEFSGTEEVAFEVKYDTPGYSVYEMLSYMMTNAAKICGVTKKYLRDENYHLDHPSQEKRTQVQFYLGCIFNSLYNLLGILNVSLEDVMKVNLEKLYSRMDRGVLSGSGDNR